MAKPRIFVSSTYYDLKAVRADLEHFIKDKGFDPVLNERGHIAYGKKEPLEDSCYREIESCDILISIIGGRFGSTSHGGPYSVSQVELRTALEQSKQVYIFIEREVFHEFKTYQNNKDEKIKWISVEDDSIFKFIEEIYALPQNNAISAFETSHDITRILQEQWAGLFQRFLQQSFRDDQSALARELRQSLETARKIMAIAGENGEDKQKVKNDLLLIEHPLFGRLQRLMRVPYRVFFLNKAELDIWFKFRGFDTLKPEVWDDETHAEWIKHDQSGATFDLIKIDLRVFDEDERIKLIDNAEWDENWVSREKRQSPSDDDDIPF